MVAASFVVLALVTAACAVMVVLARRPAYGALALVTCFLALGGIFIILGAEFLAATQVIVYAGSVMILFVFVIVTGGFSQASTRPRTPAWWVTGGTLGAVVFGELLWGLADFARGAGQAAAADLTSPVVVGGLAGLFFQDWLLPLEVLSFVILAALVGVGVLRREGRGR